MKNLNFYLFVIFFTTIISCSKDEQKPFDESIYFDQDEDCEQSKGTCCDTDGRILVLPNQIIVTPILTPQVVLQTPIIV
jgi:hypothetical protein